MKKHLRIKIYGRVQGVFFRQTTYEKAITLGLKGTVENMPDGTVEINAEGKGEDIEKLIKWSEQGPDHAQVEKVETTQKHIQNYQDFVIV